MIKWTMRDGHAAWAEGWGIYCFRTGWAIEMTTEEEFQFHSLRHYTGEARDYVARRAEEGSELHSKALAYVAQQRLLT